jgi:hypothetical protein
MKRFATPVLLAVFLAPMTFSGRAVAQSVPPEREQIAAAVRAAPPALREAATVLGYPADADGTLRTLRDGTGRLVCLSDRPGEDRFHVACYHRALKPFMKRGRMLQERGRSHSAVDSVRRAEIAAGQWAMPDHPAALYTLSGPAGSYDAAADTVRGASALKVIYLPYATAESTGLPTSAGRGEPWIMEGGTPWAHVMIVGPKQQ